VACCVQSIIQFGYPFVPKYVGDVPIVTFLFALCPWALLSKGFNDLGLAAAGTNPGLDWGQRTRCRKAFPFLSFLCFCLFAPAETAWGWPRLAPSPGSTGASAPQVERSSVRLLFLGLALGGVIMTAC
jgi:hypothetical protein